MKSFFKEALSTIKTSGTIRQSSKQLINKCLKDFNFNETSIILEFGAGDGCFTDELLNSFNSHSTLFSFEINETFHSYCKKKFNHQSNFHLIKESALDFDKTLKSHNIDKVDYIVSSLPLQLFSDKDIEKLLQKVKKYLNVGGMFVQYQYSLGKYNTIKNIFPKTNLNFTLINLPPAFVYKCYNLSSN